jgi:hypothetical protein
MSTTPDAERRSGPAEAGLVEDRRPLVLGADDVARVFDLDSGLASQREAFSRLGRSEADQPARLMLPVPHAAR